VKFASWASHHIGGDGFAFWILNNTMHPSNTKENDWSWLTGPLFGMRDDFDGIGIVFDTYDNDGMRDNPKIFVLRNDGTKTEWDHDRDFVDDMIKEGVDGDKSSTSCSFDVRQKGTYWETHLHRMLARYINGVLHIYIDTEKRTSDHLAGYKFCLAVPLAELTTKGTHHIAATALTGQVADSHDIHQITLRYLTSEDDVVVDRLLSKSSYRAGKFGILNTILHVFNCFLIAYLFYDMVSQIMSLHKIGKQFNAHYVCTQINRSIETTYRLYFAHFVVFLLWGDWTYCAFNIPLMLIRGYRYMTQTHLTHAKELAKTGSFGVNRMTVGYLEAFLLAVVFIISLRNVLGI